MATPKDPTDPSSVPSGVVLGTLVPDPARQAADSSMKDLWQQVSKPEHKALHHSDEPSQETSRPVYRLPQKFGKYTLVRRLGVGGMAEAFLAQQDGPLGFQKTCVVKRMLPHIAEEPRFVTMFQREAKVAAMLTHTNVVQIYELGVEDGIHFIAMEHVDGAPLHKLARASWRRGKAVPTEAICCAIADAALGLAAAHELVDPQSGVHLNVVHRDISPDNLMVNKEGVTKILDFGVAKLVGGEKTATGEVKGKIPFLAPEHILGQALDGRADIYALGVTFYWLTTGKRPFHAPGDLPLMEAIVKETPKPPIERNPEIPQMLNDLILRMIAKDPARRPQTGFEVHDMLQDALAFRRQVVVPFVAEMLPSMQGLDDSSESLSGQTPGFVPSTPSNETLKSAWKKRAAAFDDVALDVPPGDSSSTVETVAQSDVTLIGDGEFQPRSNKLMAAVVAVAAIVILGLIGIIVAMTASNSSTPTTTANATTPPSTNASTNATTPTSTNASTNATTPTSTNASTNATTPPSTNPVTPDAATANAATDRGTEAAANAAKVAVAVEPKSVEVKTKGPSQIRWQTEGGKPVGTGAGTFKAPAGVRALVAVDPKRGVRSTVAINAGVADYGTLARGKIQPRANPYADVFLGGDSLGQTPFPPVDVVVGTYSVRFVHDGKEQKKSVEVKSGETARVAVDFGG